MRFSTQSLTIFLSLLGPFALAQEQQDSIFLRNSTRRITKRGKKGQKKGKKSDSYEIWASDQSNSKPGVASIGVDGSYLWIWDSKDIDSDDAVPLSCTPSEATGPCDLHDIFPSTLKEYDADGNATGNVLGGLDNFGRLHGVLTDPTYGNYVTANIFAPGGGYVGIIDTETKEAIGLFRVAATTGTGSSRSVHMSFWAFDGSAVFIGNLHGKMVERIDVTRDNDGKITDLTFNKDASVYLGKGFSIEEEPTYFVGSNAFGRPLIGSMTGSYDNADTGDLTPSGTCKEKDCTGATAEVLGGDRGNNVPVCPIPSSNNNIYVTVGGGKR